MAYKRWPDSPLEEEAMFKAAESEFFADRYSKADDEYALLIKKFPSTQYLSQVVDSPLRDRPLLGAVRPGPSITGR